MTVRFLTQVTDLTVPLLFLAFNPFILSPPPVLRCVLICPTYLIQGGRAERWSPFVEKDSWEDESGE